MSFKRSSRNHREQMDDVRINWCSTCCGDGRRSEHVDPDNGVSRWNPCARCGGSRLEPTLTFQEAQAWIHTGLSVERICSGFAAKRREQMR